jgi:hypothetical protein
VIIAEHSPGEFQRLRTTNGEICLTANSPNRLVVGLDRWIGCEQPVGEPWAINQCEELESILSRLLSEMECKGESFGFCDAGNRSSTFVDSLSELLDVSVAEIRR